MKKDIHFLGETDFLPVMQNENRKWRDDHVIRGTMTTSDNLRLNYYMTEPKNPIASIVFVHGMGEFFGKYHEYIWYLYQAGFRVFFPEQRGFGYSEGKLDEPDLIYIDDYSTYVEDLHQFMDKIVLPGSFYNGQRQDVFLIAHSMGGAVSTLFMEKYPKYFKAALLSSPMIKMKADNLKTIVVIVLKIYALLFKREKSVAPNQKRFDPNTPFESSSSKSKPRFDYQLNMRRNNEHFQTTTATLGWALASMKAHKDIVANLKRIKIPVNIMTAGDDHLIDSEGYSEFAKGVPQAVIHDYPTSRHEIFNADEATRNQYYKDVFNILESYIN